MYEPATLLHRPRPPAGKILRCLGGFGLAASLLLAQAASAPAALPQPAIPVNVQGVASLGLTVRVKEVLIGSDATILTVSVSFSSRMTNSTDLASTDTFLELTNGDRLPVKRPDDNRYLKIQDGETMEGQLVFLGALPPSTTEVELVFNEGNSSDDSIGPGLKMTLPLKESGKK